MTNSHYNPGFVIGAQQLKKVAQSGWPSGWPDDHVGGQVDGRMTGWPHVGDIRMAGWPCRWPVGWPDGQNGWPDGHVGGIRITGWPFWMADGQNKCRLGSTFLFQGFTGMLQPDFLLWAYHRNVLVAFVVPNSIPLDAEHIVCGGMQNIQFFQISQYLPSPQKCLIRFKWVWMPVVNIG